MSDEPRVSNVKGKARARTELTGENAANDGGPSSDQQAREKRKPRKLEKRSVVLQEPIITLETRVERLESQFASLNSRIDAVEVRQVRRPTAATYRRSSSTSTRATSVGRARPRGTPRHSSGAGSSKLPRPSLAEQLRESHRLLKTHQRRRSGETDSIEEIPRSALTVNQPRQVALTGQYKIPLPGGFSPEDVMNIQQGLTAAGSIARSLANAWTTPTTPSQTQDAGTSGTTTPRGTTSTPAATVGRSRSVVHARSGGAKRPHDSASDRQEQEEAPQRGDDDKENVFDAGASKGNAEFSPGVGAGNAQPEEYVTIGAEHASKSWRTFILQAGGAVASAAKDAAVEFSSQSPYPADSNANTTHGHPEASSAERASSVSSSSTRRREGGSPIRRSKAGYAASTASSSQRSRPKASKTSSRASSRV